jgi:type IV pilus assembly protein PilC
MPATFDYKVRDKTGALVTGQLVGDNEALVMTKLRQMGLTPIRVKQASTGLKMEIHLRPGRVKLKQIALFCRQFATMVNSGLPILRALSILTDQTESKELSKILFAVRADVENGSSLSARMAGHPKAFNNLFISMVKAG